MDTLHTPVKTIDAYIHTFPKEVQKILQTIRQKIKEVAPEATETINYQIPTFKFYGNLVHFAAYKHHIGLYPTPSGINAFQKELLSYKTSKGVIQFPIDQPIPLPLIRKIVAFRVKEVLEKR